MESPDAGEVSFIDAQGQAHARRWTHRQSGVSAVREGSASVLIVMEGLHPGAREDVDRLAQALAQAIEACWQVQATTGALTQAQPVFTFG